MRKKKNTLMMVIIMLLLLLLIICIEYDCFIDHIIGNIESIISIIGIIIGIIESSSIVIISYD